MVTIEDLTSEEGGEAKFSVKVRGEPTPEVMWFHENEPIKDDDIYKIMPGEGGEVVLHLPEVFPEDAGVYTVKAVNEAGEVSCSAVLTVIQGERLKVKASTVDNDSNSQYFMKRSRTS